MLAAVFGLSAVLNEYPNAMVGAQWMGVAYICWTGLKLLHTSMNTKKIDINLKNEGWRYFRQALAISLTNPNAIMFFISFFPLFLNGESTPITLLVLMFHVTAISFIYQTCLVLIGNTASRRLSRWQPFRLIVNRLAGISLIGFGVSLAFSNR